MKTVFTSAELPHLWASKSVPAGRCPANESFDGPDYYSYSTVIASHREHAGKPYVVITSASHSPTTGKHVSSVRSALRGHATPVFAFPGTERGRYSLSGATPAALFDHAVKRSAECEAKAERARSNKDWHTREAATWLEKAAEINKFFGLRRKVDAKTVSRLKDAAAREEKKNAAARREQEKARAERDKEVREKNRQYYEDWKAGSVPGGYFNLRDFPVAFRIEDNELVSSMGARVPLDSARVALRFALRKRGTEWRRNGETCPVGYYQLDSISDVGIIAGCHRISWAEIDRVTALLCESVREAA